MSRAGERAGGAARWFLRSLIWLAPILLAVDIVSKLGFEKLLLGRPGEAVTVIPGFFRFSLVYNDGAAWGLFAGNDWLLVTISSVAGVGMIAYLAWRWGRLPAFQRIALLLMIPGCLGNLIDRAFYPHGVIDFLEFTFGSYVFPTFNFADSYLVIGVLVLLIGEIIHEYRETKKKGDVKVDEKRLAAEIRDYESEREAEDDGPTDDR